MNSHLCNIQGCLSKRQTIVILFLFFQILCHAQNRDLAKVIGYVYDAKGMPVPSASVFVPNSAYSTASDSTGHYVLLLPSGDHTLLVSALGYVAEKYPISLMKSENKHVQFKLKIDPNTTIEQVVVEGKSAIQEVRETPFNVVALDAKSQYNSTMNLADLLGKASGIKIRESGGVGSDVNISLNGFTGRHVKIFMDGVPMQGASSSFQLNNIPVSLAERIEVYKGVVPIEFGADAIGGVINIVTNQASNSFLDASYSFGSFNTHRTNILLGHTTKNGFSVQLNAYQTYSNNSYKVRTELLDANGNYGETQLYKRFHDTYHNEAIVGKFGWVNKPWATRFFVGATLSQEHKDIQNSATNMRFVYGARENKGSGVSPTLEYYKRDLFVKGLTVRLNGNYNFNSNHNIDTASYVYNWLGERTLSASKGEGGSNLLSDYKNSNYATTGNITYQINERHSISINDVQSGSTRRMSAIIAPEDLTAIDTMRRLSLKNVLGMSYRYRHSRNWNSNLFVKNYYQKVIGPFNEGDEAHASYVERSPTYNTTGYGAATTYFLKTYQFKASAERAFRLPTDSELFGDEIQEQANASLRAENSLNFNLGATMNHEFANQDVLYVDVNGFYRFTKDFIRREALARTGGIVNINHGRVSTLGVDIEARYYYRNIFSIGGTMTYQNLRNRETNATSTGSRTNGQYNDRMPNIPYLFGNADAAYYLHGLGGKQNVLSLTYSMHAIGEFYVQWESLGGAGGKATLPTQISHDFAMTYSIRNGLYNFTVEGSNLTNVDLYDNFGMMKPGRAVYAKFRYYLLRRK